MGKAGSCSKVLERQGQSRLAHNKVFRSRPSETGAELYAGYLIRDEIIVFMLNSFLLVFVDFDSEEDALHLTLKGLLLTKRFHKIHFSLARLVHRERSQIPILLFLPAIRSDCFEQFSKK